MTPHATSASVADQLKDATLFKESAFINNTWVDASARIAVSNPANGETIGHVPDLGAADTQRAIDAAAAAFPAWRALPAAKRSELLEKWFNAITEHAEDLARILTIEQGKPLNESRGEIIYGAGSVKWFAEEGKLVYGETFPARPPDRRIIVLKEPIGVCAAITPWNFPNAMITRKVAPALAAG